MRNIACCEQKHVKNLRAIVNLQHPRGRSLFIIYENQGFTCLVCKKKVYACSTVSSLGILLTCVCLLPSVTVTDGVAYKSFFHHLICMLLYLKKHNLKPEVVVYIKAVL